MEDFSCETSLRRIISESFFIWLFLIIIIWGNYYIIGLYNDSHLPRALYALILGNIIFGTQFIFGVIIFVNYIKYSKNRTVLFTADIVRLVNSANSEQIEINNDEVITFEVFSSKSSRPPWGSFEYIRLVDNSGNEIIVTSFTMDISYEKVDILSQNFRSAHVDRQTRFLPLISA